MFNTWKVGNKYIAIYLPLQLLNSLSALPILMSPPLCSVFTSLVAVWTKPKCSNVESYNRRAMDHEKSNCQIRVNSGSKNCITKVPVHFHSFYSSGNDKCWRGCGETGTLLCCCQESKTMQLLWKTFWLLLIRLNMELPFAQCKRQQMETTRCLLPL